MNSTARVLWLFRSCWRKRAFDAEADAQRVAKRFDQRVYRCEACSRYHLATKKPPAPIGRERIRMKRTLVLKVFLHEEDGLSLTVKHTEVAGEDGSKETHSTEATDAWGPNASLQDAARKSIEDYFGRLRADAKGNETPIEKAAR